MSKQLQTHLLQLLILLLACLAPSAIAQSQNTQIEIEGFDTSALDTKIADAAVKANAPGAGAKAKLDAANLYLERANLFYNAGRPLLYKLCLGDLRRVLRFQPDNEEAIAKRDQIIEIYKSMLRPVPANGDEGDAYNDPHARYKVNPESINFSTKEPSVNRSGNLLPDTTYVYEITTTPGQHIDVSVTSGADATVLSIYQGSLEEASRIVAGDTKWSAIASEPGKYFVRVSSKNVETSYELKVTVR